MRRLNRYCAVRQQIKMSWHPYNCFNLATRKTPLPLPLNNYNLFQTEWRCRTLCRLYFNGDVSTRTFIRTFECNGRNIFATVAAMERRVDNVLFRSLFASSIYAARKMVSDGKVTVNGKPCKLPDYRMQDGDILQVKPKWADQVFALVKNPWMRMWAHVPQYLEVSRAALATVFLQKPIFEQIPSAYPRWMVAAMGNFYCKRGHRKYPEHGKRKKNVPRYSHR